MGNERLAGKVAVVTGAASGIGRATAERFALEGARLVVNDLSEDKLAGLFHHLNPSQMHMVAGDVSHSDVAERLIQTAINKYGTVDILVNNAGIHYIRDITECDASEFDRAFDCNLKSMFLCAKFAIQQMQQQQQGAIINLASISSYVGQEMMGKSTFMYNMTKAGALQLTRSLATRYAVDGIRVNCVVPGPIRTNQITMDHTSNLDEFWAAAANSTPMKRYGKPEEVANCILFLASDEASYVTGCPLIVDGGYLSQ